ncbi:hypothetical protein PVAG01_00064 [Phlyctema vagabunda]|uniref:Uncharacterized protein n=1 Tax=Phlyctema vagabunda TaxID=108571 RepID=A0ABR4PT88_9HELO
MAEPAAKAHEAEDEVDVEAEAEEDTAAAIEMDRIEEEEEEEEKEEEAEGEAGHERGEETEVPPQETTGSQSAAKPFTAATLYTLEQAARSRFASLGSKIRTSCCSEFDDYLFSGGVERGIVLGLSGELDVSRLISFHLLASALLSTEAAERGDATGGAEKRGRVVSIIDTTGSFPLHLLVGVLRSRISELERREEVREARVSGLLERISITRIFDIEGFWEVLHSEFSSSTALGKENQLETRNEACQVLVVEPLSTLIYTLFSHAERSAGESAFLLQKSRGQRDMPRNKNNEMQHSN